MQPLSGRAAATGGGAGCEAVLGAGGAAEAGLFAARSVASRWLLESGLKQTGSAFREMKL